MNVYDLDTGPLINVVSTLLNPEPIYGAMVGMSGLAFIFFWLFPLFIAFRFLRESMGLGWQASLGKAFGDMGNTLKLYVMYSSLGLAFFALIFFAQDLVRETGSLALIESDLASFRQDMISTKQQESDWIESLLKKASDMGGVFSAPLFFILYQLSSMFYVLVKHLMQFLFAFFVAILYAWGFIAIASQALPKQVQLFEGFIRSYVTLAVWAILTPIAMGLVWLVMQPAEVALLRVYSGGLGTTALNVWSIFASILLIVVSVILIILPFLATRLASNQSFGDAVAMGGAGLSAIIANQMASYFKDQAAAQAGMAGQLMPSGEGTRRRDGMYQGMSDKVGGAMNVDLVSKAGQMLSNLSGSSASEGSSAVDSTSSPMSSNVGSHSDDFSTTTPTQAEGVSVHDGLSNVTGSEVQQAQASSSPSSDSRIDSAQATSKSNSGKLDNVREQEDENRTPESPREQDGVANDGTVPPNTGLGSLSGDDSKIKPVDSGATGDAVNEAQTQENASESPLSESRKGLDSLTDHIGKEGN